MVIIAFRPDYSIYYCIEPVSNVMDRFSILLIYWMVKQFGKQKGLDLFKVYYGA